MAHLHLSLVEDIGRTSASRVIGDDFDAIEVAAGADHTGQDAYFFTFSFRSRVFLLPKTRTAPAMRSFTGLLIMAE